MICHPSDLELMGYLHFMKITVGQLKRLIAEAMAPPPDKRAAQLVDATVDAATAYVDSLVAGSPDKGAVERLKSLSDQTTSLARWMSSRHEKLAAPLSKFAQVAQDVTKDVGFWNRPSFLNKDEYVQKMKSKVKRLQNAQISVMSN